MSPWTFFGRLFSSASAFDSSPAVNIDGSPMVGPVDIHGNPFGVIDSTPGWSSSSDFGCGSSIGSGFDSNSFGSSDW